MLVATNGQPIARTKRQKHWDGCDGESLAHYAIERLHMAGITHTDKGTPITRQTIWIYRPNKNWFRPRRMDAPLFRLDK